MFFQNAIDLDEIWTALLKMCKIKKVCVYHNFSLESSVCAFGQLGMFVLIKIRPKLLINLNWNILKMYAF